MMQNIKKLILLFSFVTVSTQAMEYVGLHKKTDGIYFSPTLFYCGSTEVRKPEDNNGNTYFIQGEPAAKYHGTLACKSAISTGLFTSLTGLGLYSVGSAVTSGNMIAGSLTHTAAGAVLLLGIGWIAISGTGVAVNTYEVVKFNKWERTKREENKAKL
jgi:hypothetical protein